MVQGVPSRKFVGYTKLEVVDTPESHAAIQRHLDRLKKWIDRNLMKFRKGKCKTLHLGRFNPIQKCMLESQCYRGNTMQEIWKCLHLFSNHGNEILPGCHNKCFENFSNWCFKEREEMKNNSEKKFGLSYINGQ